MLFGVMSAGLFVLGNAIAHGPPFFLVALIPLLPVFVVAWVGDIHLPVNATSCLIVFLIQFVVAFGVCRAVQPSVESIAIDKGPDSNEER